MEETRLMAMLEKFEAAAKALQASMLTRNADEIWGALEEQEQAASEVGAIIHANAEAFAGLSRRNSAVRRLLQRCQSMLRANRAMAARYLDVIDQTFAQLGGRSAPARGYGALPHRSSPLIVCQQG